MAGLTSLIFFHAEGRRRLSAPQKVSGADEMLNGMDVFSTCNSFVVAATALAAEHVDAPTPRESRIADVCNAPGPSRSDLVEIQDLIRVGRDSLGTAYCRAHSAELRHPLGQTCTS